MFASSKKPDIDNLDIGFRVIKIDTSNMNELHHYGNQDAVMDRQLEKSHKGTYHSLFGTYQ